MTKLYGKRFEELEAQIIEIESTQQQKYSEYSGSYIHVDSNLVLNWQVKAKNLLVSVCGENSQHFTAFLEAEKATGFDNTLNIVSRLKAVFLAAKEDFLGGYLNTVRNIIQAEVFDNELEQASELLTSGYKSAAAVIAGVVLETTIRNLCLAQSIELGKLDKMNADLVKSGYYNGLTQKRVTSLAAIRNSAAHGKPDDFTTSDIKAMIEDIQRFVELHLN